MQSGEVSNITVSPVNPDIMFLGVEVNAHSAYKSTDRGKSWRRIHSYDHNKDIAVHPSDPNIVLLADSQHIWRSTSGGEGNQRTGEGARGGPPPSFEQVLKNNSAPGPSESSFSTLAAAPSQPDIWYTAVRGSSNDGGYGGFGSGKTNLWRSADAGLTWQERPVKSPSTILVLAVDRQNADRLLAGSEDGIYQSLDGGASFERLTKAQHVTALASIDNQLWLAASLDGVLRSTDGGKSWQKANKGLPSPTVLRIALVRDQPTVAWATTIEGVARSTDSGQSWQNVSADLPAKNLQALAVDPTNPNLAIVSTETFMFSVRSENRLFRQGQYYKQGIYRTEDGGKSWTRSDKGLIEENILDVTAHPTRPREVWASQQSSRGLYRSRDAGQSWSLSPHLLTHYPMRTVFFPNEADKLAHTSLHIGEDFGLSDDSGSNWATLSESTFFKALTAGKKLYTEGKRHGANLHLHGLAVDPKNPKIIYVGSVDDPSSFNEKAVKGAHIYKSVDGGKTWQESDDGYDHEYATSINDIKIDPQNTDVLYVGMTKKESTNGNGVWKSVDGAKSWQRANAGMPDNASVSTLIIHPKKSNQLLAATFEGLYRSTDGGANWVRQKSGVFKDIEYDPTNPDIVYTGSGPEGFSQEGKNGIFVSTDFGENWKDISNNLPSTKVTSVGVSADGKIVYAGTEDFGLFAAYDRSIGTPPADDKTKTELGKQRGQGGPPPDADRRGEYGGGPGGGEHGGDRRDGRPFFASLFGNERPFGGGEPPIWFKAIVMLVGLTIVACISLIVRRLRHRHDN